MKKTGIALLALVVLCGFFAWWFSPSQVVRRKTETLLDLISFEKGQGVVGRQTRVYSMSGLLATEVELVSDSHPGVDGMREKGEIESGYAWMAEHVVQSSFDRVEFRKVEVRKPVAEVELTVDGEVELPGSRPLDGRHEVFLLWMHDGTSWRLGHVRWKRAD